MLIRRISLLVLVALLVSCAGTMPIKREQYTLKGESVVLSLISEEMRDYNYVPLLNVRTIKVSLFNQSACPEFSWYDSEKGYMYTVEVDKHNWQLNIDVPLEKTIYLRLENEVSGAGSSKTCTSYLKFNPLTERSYILDLKIQRVGFGCNAPFALSVKREDGEVKPESSMRPARFIDSSVDSSFCV